MEAVVVCEDGSQTEVNEAKKALLCGSCPGYLWR